MGIDLRRPAGASAAMALDEPGVAIADGLFRRVAVLTAVGSLLGWPFWGNPRAATTVLGLLFAVAMVGRHLVARGRHRLAMHIAATVITGLAILHALVAPRPTVGAVILMTPLATYAAVCGRRYALAAAGTFLAAAAGSLVAYRFGVTRPVLFPVPPAAELAAVSIGLFGVLGPLDMVVERLRLAVVDAQAGNRARTEFFANVSHEIRTPMNAILGLCHLMEADGPTPAQAQRLARLTGSARHLLAIIDDVLDLSRVDLGKLPLRLQPFDPAAVLHEVHEMVRPMAEASGLLLAVELAGDLPQQVVGDPQRIRQVLLNLAGNGVKYTPQGTVTLRLVRAAVHSRRVVEAGAPVSLRFEVVDTGVGLSESDRHRIFNAFEQVDGFNRRSYAGSGLGLAVCQGLVRLMNGRIGVESRLGAGSTFWFEVDLAEARQADAAPDPLLGTRHQPRRRLRVLVVDDDAVSREVAHDLLEAEGHTVELAIDGTHALVAAAGHVFDTVLLDLNMPVLDGLATARALRQLPGYADTPLVALTANALEETRHRCDEAGIGYVLTKPFLPAHLFALLNGLPVPSQPAPVEVAAGTPPCAGCFAAVRGLDVNVGLSYVADDVARYRAILATFIGSHERTAEEARRLTQSGDAAEARRLVHSLKGAAAVVGATVVKTTAAEIEAMLARGVEGATADTVALPSRLDALQVATETLMADLRVALGAQKPAVSATGPVRQATVVPPAALPTGVDRRPTVLAVEDSPVQLAALVAALTPEYRVRVATTGPAALAIVEGPEPPDLVLLDVLLPGISGFEVCRAIKANPERREVPIIFVSALGEATDEREGLDAGGIDYVTKPIHPAIVSARVRNHLDLREQRRQVQESLDRLRTLEHMRDELVHMVVHDFRAPLMVLGMSIDLAMTVEALPERMRSDLGVARSSATRLGDMVTAMLDISRMEAGSMPLTAEPCDLSTLAHNTGRELSGLVRARSYTVDEGPVVVSADPQLIARVLQNLVANALQFTGESGRVHVGFDQVAEGVRCSVVDDGHGVPPAFRERIFEKFGQAAGRAPGEPQRRSTGLGLTFCKLAVELHGGQIGVTGAPGGQGSEFWFTLPCAASDASPT